MTLQPSTRETPLEYAIMCDLTRGNCLMSGSPCVDGRWTNQE